MENKKAFITADIHPFLQQQLEQKYIVDVDVAVSRLFAFDTFGQIVRVDRQEPAHSGMLVLQISACFGFAEVMHFVVLERTENEVQHVEKVHPDVRYNAERFAGIALPTGGIPFATRGDVG